MTMRRFAVAVGGTLLGTVLAVQAVASPASAAAGPTTPTGLQVTAATFTSITIDFNPSTEAGSTGGISYRVSLNGSSPFFAYDFPTVSHDQWGVPLRPGTTYRIAIQAVGMGTSELSDPVTATTVADHEPPTTPANLRCSDGPDGVCWWGASTDNAGWVTYNLYLDGKPWVSYSETMYPYFSVGDLRSHQVTVRAADLAGNLSGISNAVTISG
jgi:hypothetical protein